MNTRDKKKPCGGDADAGKTHQSKADKKCGGADAGKAQQSKADEKPPCGADTGKVQQSKADKKPPSGPDAGKAPQSKVVDKPPCGAGAGKPQQSKVDKKPPGGANAGKTQQSKSGFYPCTETGDNQDSDQATTKIVNGQLSSLLMENPVNTKKIMKYAQSMKFDGMELLNIASTYVSSVEKRPKVTPLLVACCGSKTEIVETLVREGWSVNYVNGQFDSPLRIAFHSENIPVAQLLLELGADPMCRNMDGSLPMEAAINTINKRNEPSLKAVELLLKNGVPVNTILQEKWKNTALHYAVLCNNTSVVQLLLTKGADPNVKTTDGSTPLHMAVYVNKEEVIKLLLSYGADACIGNGFGYPPLMSAVQNSYIISIKALIEGGVDIHCSCNEEKTTALNLAVKMLNLDVVKLLISLGADPNNEGGCGETPLHVLAYVNIQTEDKGRFQVWDEIAKCLIENGADINGIRGLLH